MSSGDEVNIIDVVEFSSHLGSEQPAGTSWRHSPGFDFLGIRPHQVAEGAFMRDFHSSFDKSDLVNGFDVWRESTMDAEYLALDDSSDAQVVEHFCAIFPWVGISVLSDSLVVEAVDSGNLSCFMVSSEQSNVCGVLKFEAQ